MTESSPWPSLGSRGSIVRFESEFEVGHTLGKGAFGRVIVARNRLDQEDYALKSVKIRKGEDVVRILREVSTLSRLPGHANVVRYYQAWIEGSARDRRRTVYAAALQLKGRQALIEDEEEDEDDEDAAIEAANEAALGSGSDDDGGEDLTAATVARPRPEMHRASSSAFGFEPATEGSTGPGAGTRWESFSDLGDELGGSTSSTDGGGDEGGSPSAVERTLHIQMEYCRHSIA